jgi:hypothetical protein
MSRTRCPGSSSSFAARCRFFCACAVSIDWSAAVKLPVAVQEEVVERVGEVVVVRHVALRPLDRVELLDGAVPAADPLEDRRREIGRCEVHVLGDEGEEGVDIGILDREPSVHVGLAEAEPRIEEELALEGAVAEPHRDRRPGLAGEDVDRAPGVDDPERAAPNEAAQEMREQHRAGLSLRSNLALLSGK